MNHLGSVTHVTDHKGEVVEQYSYDVYGRAIRTAGKATATTIGIIIGYKIVKWGIAAIAAPATGGSCLGVAQKQRPCIEWNQ